jgi:hypothetical protein
VVARRPRNVPVEHRDVVVVDRERLQCGVAVAGDVGRDRLEAQPVTDPLRQKRFVLDDQHAHTAHGTSAGISCAYRKTHTPSQRALR